MENNKMKDLLKIAEEAAVEAGKVIMEIYGTDDFMVETKDDDSPLTIADKKANDVIMTYLEKTGIPVLSEEGREIGYAERKEWDRLWIVDPLDGTKEFIKRNGEFTVNIALIENQKSIMGVIYVPVAEVLYSGLVGDGATKVENGTKVSMPVPKEDRAFTAVGSRSHMSEETIAFFEDLRAKHGTVEVTSMGSSLKICLVAEGIADVYPRFAPTMEWDTAAGHAIAVAAGKNIIDYNTKSEMLYNRENLLNNWFIVQ